MAREGVRREGIGVKGKGGRGVCCGDGREEGVAVCVVKARGEAWTKPKDRQSDGWPP